MVKKDSLKRIISQFRNVDIQDIAKIQATNEAQKIRDVLNKPNLSDKTALAYKRLANQYVNLIDEPNFETIKKVNTIFKGSVIIDFDYEHNLRVLGNKKDFDVVVNPDIKSTIIYITHKTPFLSANNYWNISFNVKDFQKEGLRALQRIEIYQSYLKKVGINVVRLFMRLKTDKGDKWVSCSKSKLNNSKKLFNWYKDFSFVILDSAYYYANDRITYKVEKIEEITVGFYP